MQKRNKRAKIPYDYDVNINQCLTCRIKSTAIKRFKWLNLKDEPRNSSKHPGPELNSN